MSRDPDPVVFFSADPSSTEGCRSRGPFNGPLSEPVQYTPVSGHCCGDDDHGTAGDMDATGARVYALDDLEPDAPITKQGALWTDGDDLLALGQGLEAQGKKEFVDPVPRRRFRIMVHTHDPDRNTDFMSDEEIMARRNHHTISQLMREGMNVPMRFVYDPIIHEQQFKLNLVFEADFHTLRGLQAKMEANPQHEIVVPVDFKAMKTQFRKLTTLMAGNYHAGIHEIRVTGYQNQGCPISWSANLETGVPHDRGVIPWFSRNTVHSSRGAHHGFHIIRNHTVPHCNIVVLIGDYSLVCQPSWTRWAQVDLGAELEKLAPMRRDDCYVIRYKSDTSTQAVDPIQYEVARSWDLIYEEIKAAIEAAQTTLKLEDVVREAKVSGTAEQTVEVCVPRGILENFMKEKYTLTNAGRHMMCFDKMQMVFTPATSNAMSVVKRALDVRRNMGDFFQDPECLLSVTVEVAMVLAMRTFNTAQARHMQKVLANKEREALRKNRAEALHRLL